MSNGSSAEKKTHPLKLLGVQSLPSIISQLHTEAIVLEPRDSFDPCIIGVDGDGRAIYDACKIVNHLHEEILECKDEYDPEDCTYSIAVEHYYYNIECAYFGTMTPLYTELVFE